MIYRATHSLFRTLNLSLGSLALLILISLLISGGIIFKIRSSVDLLVGDTFPALSSVNEIKIQNNYIAGNVPNLVLIENQMALQGSVDALLNANEVILEHMEILQESELLRPSNDTLQASLLVKQLISDQLTKLKERNTLKQMMNIGEERLLGLITKAKRELDIALVNIEFEMQEEKGESTETLSFLLQDLYKLLAEFENLSLFLTQANNLQEPMLMKDYQQKFGFVLRTVVADLSAVSLSEHQRPLALVLADLYEEYLSEHGFFNSGLLLIDSDKRAQENNALIAEQLDIVHSDLNLIFDRASQLSDRSVFDLGEQASFALASLSLVAFFIISILMFFLLVLVPKKIINPLRAVTQAIFEVGEGKGAFTKFDSSSTELKGIEEALHVFVENAEKLQERERELIEKNTQLDKKNSDLSTFTRVSSHDLKSPLRGVRLLCAMLKDNIDEKELEDAYYNLDRIDSRISRLEGLLNSLLDYTKADEFSGESVNIEPCELIKNQFEMLDKAHHFTLNIDCDADKMQVLEVPFAIVIRNLIDNAIKHHDRKEGNILVKVKASCDLYWEVVVEDDGPGVDSQYQERIFKPFETLRPKDQLETSGMGLAIITKMVASFGGLVRLHSPVEQDRGSRFVVTWPKRTAKV